MSKINVLSGIPGFVVFLIVVAAFALIAIIAFIIHKILNPKLKDDKKENTEAENVKETLDRYLEPVEDDKVSKEIQDYQEKDDE